MKEFAIYTLLRFALFGAVLAIVLGVWWAATGADGITETQLLVSMVAAFVLSGVASYKLLDPYRQKLAQRVEERASRARERFEEARAKEDGVDPGRD